MKTISETVEYFLMLYRKSQMLFYYCSHIILITVSDPSATTFFGSFSDDLLFLLIYTAF